MRLLVVAGLAAAGIACDPAVDDAVPLRLLQANVGTALLACDAYVFKLCDADAEAAIAAAVDAIDADVIALQEVLPDAVCDAIDAGGGEANPARSCHPDVRAAAASQRARIVSDDRYDVRCDDRNGFECVAVARDRVRFVGDYVTAAAIASVDGDACDPGFSVGSVDVDVDGLAVRIINGHPQSTKDTCRAAQVRQIFDELAVAGAVDAVVVSGDMNLDPFNLGLDADDVSVDVWRAHVADDPDDDTAPFVYASGPAEREPPHPTTTTALFTATLDHVAVSGGAGRCATLGAAPNTVNLDDNAGAMDHRALDCALVLGPGAAAAR